MALRNAIERNDLLLHYQPLISLAEGSVVGAEALVRWDSEEHADLRIGDMIRLAEDTGLIVPMGEWVIAEACAQRALWAIWCRRTSVFT